MEKRRLLSYEEGFSWCSECKYVSSIHERSELKYMGLKGCQRRSCPRCFQWVDVSPYEDEDFVYEGEKDMKECEWFVSGRGCEDGNKCMLKHPKWDETDPKNKNRCYVCGQRNDHWARHCSRPGGQMEGADAMSYGERSRLFTVLPKRPNGEAAVIPPYHHEGRKYDSIFVERGGTGGAE